MKHKVEKTLQYKKIEAIGRAANEQGCERERCPYTSDSLAEKAWLEGWDSVKPHHYFATCAFGWQVAETREEALSKLIKAFRHDASKVVKNSVSSGDMGFYVWSCRVDVPKSTKYHIEFYQPKGVPLADAVEGSIVYMTTKIATMISASKDGRLQATKLELTKEKS